MTPDRCRLPSARGCAAGWVGRSRTLSWLWDIPRHQSLSYVDLAFFRRVGDTGAHVGDCGADDKAYMDWSFGLHAGKLLCVATPTRARFDWTFGGEDVLATAERDDGDQKRSISGGSRQAAGSCIDVTAGPPVPGGWQPPPTARRARKGGAEGGTRTHDRRFTKPMLYH